MYVRRTSAYKTPIMHFHTNKKIQETNQKNMKKKQRKERKFFTNKRNTWSKYKNPLQKTSKKHMTNFCLVPLNMKKTKKRTFVQIKETQDQQTKTQFKKPQKNINSKFPRQNNSSRKKEQIYPASNKIGVPSHLARTATWTFLGLRFSPQETEPNPQNPTTQTRMTRTQEPDLKRVPIDRSSKHIRVQQDPTLLVKSSLCVPVLYW